MATETIDWFQSFHTVREYDYHAGKIQFFLGGKTNVSYNCLARHLATRAEKTAIIWEGNEPGNSPCLSYRELYHEIR